MKLNITAPAKINLYLDVLGKMENGYHNLDSIMQSISLCDNVILDIEKTGTDNENVIEIQTTTDKIPNDKSNLVYKASAKFFEHTKIKGAKCVFTIEKNIPISAGMAGGSTDGAAALKLLNEAYDYPLNSDELLKIGAKIGADVPFCLTGGTSICQGIGEKIERITPFNDILLVCAIDNSSVSTPVAFGMLDDKYGTNCSSSGEMDKLISAIDKGSISEASKYLYNKFENVIIPTNENVAMIKNVLLQNGAIGALMSGSGPSVFGIFDNENDQRKAYEALKDLSIRAFLCKTI